MELTDIENNLVNNYWITLKRKKISNITINNFIKKPYIEKYIIDLSVILDNNIIINNILHLIDSNNINNSEIIFFINNYVELNNESKKNIEKYILENDLTEEDMNNICIETIIYVIKYFRFYQTICELLFDSIIEDNELYNFILIYMKNRENDIKLYIKKNFKFKIFYYYINDLYQHYEKLNNIFIKLELIKGNNDFLNYFLKNLFTPWYNLYKKDIIENNVNTKIKGHVIKKSILSRLLCMNNS